MTELRGFELMTDHDRMRAIGAVRAAPARHIVILREPKGDELRTLQQNRVQWPILQAFADQRSWQVNGEQCYLSADDWKDLLTANFRREALRTAPGIDGGMVLLGLRTSKFTKSEFGDWVHHLNAAAAHMGVVL